MEIHHMLLFLYSILLFKIDFIVWKFKSEYSGDGKYDSLKQTLQYGNIVKPQYDNFLPNRLKQTLQYGNLTMVNAFPEQHSSLKQTLQYGNCQKCHRKYHNKYDGLKQTLQYGNLLARIRSTKNLWFKIEFIVWKST